MNSDFKVGCTVPLALDLSQLRRFQDKVGTLTEHTFENSTFAIRASIECVVTVLR